MCINEKDGSIYIWHRNAKYISKKDEKYIIMQLKVQH
jgi:hypothetical protein